MISSLKQIIVFSDVSWLVWYGYFYPVNPIYKLILQLIGSAWYIGTEE